MRILSITLDRRALDSTSAVGQRQADYYRDHEVSYISLDDPTRAKVFVFLSAWRQARRARGFDVVTAQDPFFCGFIGRVAAKASGASLHIQDHSAAFARKPRGWKEKLMYWSARKTVKHAARIRTVSQRGKKGLMSIGVQESKIDVIPIATDVSVFSAIDRSSALPEQILTVTRLESEKGVDVLLHAMVEILKARPQASLVVVGDGSLRHAYERMSRKLGIGSSVLFLGKEDDVKPFMARAGVYVQPSHFEGWGLAVIEAAAAGMPIVMTDVGCAGEVIKDGESGLVVKPGDAKALAAALVRVLSDAHLAKSLGEKAKLAVTSLLDAQATAGFIRQSLEAARKAS